MMDPIIDDFAWIDLRRLESIALWFWEVVPAPNPIFVELEKAMLELLGRKDA